MNGTTHSAKVTHAPAHSQKESDETGVGRKEGETNRRTLPPKTQLKTHVNSREDDLLTHTHTHTHTGKTDRGDRPTYESRKVGRQTDTQILYLFTPTSSKNTFLPEYELWSFARKEKIKQRTYEQKEEQESEIQSGELRRQRRENENLKGRKSKGKKLRR